MQNKSEPLYPPRLLKQHLESETYMGMIFSINQPKPLLTIIKNNLTPLEKWSYLVPVISTFAIGSFFSPYSTGAAIAIGLFNFSARFLIRLGMHKNCHPHNHHLLNKEGQIEKQMGEKQTHQSYTPMFTTLIVPIWEEILFRGSLQPLVTHTIVQLFPTAAAVTLTGSMITVAAMISILVTNVFFGWLHAYNENPPNYNWAFLATLGGIINGVVAEHLGLIAAIYVHIVNNTLSATVRQLTKLDHLKIKTEGSFNSSYA